MAELKLNNVTTITESGGALTLANAALGTPTSATLTNATFPAGHVIQTTFNQYSAGASDTLASQTLTIVEVGSDVRHWNGVINNVLASSSVLISCQFQYRIVSSSADPGAGFGFFRLDAATSTTTQIYPTTSEDSLIHSTYYFVARGTASSGLFYYGIPHLTFLDTSPGTGTNTYYLGMSTNNGTIDIFTSIPFHIVLQEIAG